MPEPTFSSPGRGCPRCAKPVPLVPGESPGEWTCKRCGGHHLDGPATRALVVTELGVAADVLRNLPALHGGQETVPCPCGAAKAATCVLRGVAVNLCPACDGLWLDSGELFRLSAGRRGTPSTGRQPKRLRLEQETAREGILKLVTLLGLALLICAVVAEWMEPSLDVAPYALGGLVVFAIGLPLTKATNDYAFIDPSRRALILHRQFLGTVRREVACPASLATCTTTTARYVSGTRYRAAHWQHWAVLVRQDGHRFDLSSREVSFAQAAEVAREAAEALGVPHVQGAEEQPIVLRREAGSVAVSHGGTGLHRASAFGIRLAGAAVAIAIVVGGAYSGLHAAVTLTLAMIVIVATFKMS